jgi:pimeloyl-ACP methyl ester carboxylesterase
MKGLRALMDMPLQQIRVPVLVVHHAQDGCKFCPYSQAVTLVDKLPDVPRKALITMDGGVSKGDPCFEWAYHGFNGIEAETVTRIADWVTTN